MFNITEYCVLFAKYGFSILCWHFTSGIISPFIICSLFLFCHRVLADKNCPIIEQSSKISCTTSIFWYKQFFYYHQTGQYANCWRIVALRSRFAHNVRNGKSPARDHFVLNGTAYSDFIVKMYWLRLMSEQIKYCYTPTTLYSLRNLMWQRAYYVPIVNKTLVIELLTYFM